MPGGFVCSASLKGRTTNDDVKEATAGTLPLRNLYSKTQRAFYAEHAPDGIGLDDLVVLGRSRPQAEAHAGRVRAQARRRALEYPDGSRILELSTKCRPGRGGRGRRGGQCASRAIGIDSRANSRRRRPRLCGTSRASRRTGGRSAVLELSSRVSFDAVTLSVRPNSDLMSGRFHGPTPPRRSGVILVTHPAADQGISGTRLRGRGKCARVAARPPGHRPPCDSSPAVHHEVFEQAPVIPSGWTPPTA